MKDIQHHHIFLWLLMLLFPNSRNIMAFNDIFSYNRSGIHGLKPIGHKVRVGSSEISDHEKYLQSRIKSGHYRSRCTGMPVQTSSVQCDRLLRDSLSLSLITQQAVTIFIILFWSWDCSFWIESHSSLTSSRAIPREIVRAKSGAIAFACNWYFMIGKVDLPEYDWSIYHQLVYLWVINYESWWFCCGLTSWTNSQAGHCITNSNGQWCFSATLWHGSNANATWEELIGNRKETTTDWFDCRTDILLQFNWFLYTLAQFKRLPQNDFR